MEPTYLERNNILIRFEYDFLQQIMHVEDRWCPRSYTLKTCILIERHRWRRQAIIAFNSIRIT